MLSQETALRALRVRVESEDLYQQAVSIRQSEVSRMVTCSNCSVVRNFIDSFPNIMLIIISFVRSSKACCFPSRWKDQCHQYVLLLLNLTMFLLTATILTYPESGELLSGINL